MIMLNREVCHHGIVGQLKAQSVNPKCKYKNKTNKKSSVFSFGFQMHSLLSVIDSSITSSDAVEEHQKNVI